MAQRQHRASLKRGLLGGALAALILTICCAPVILFGRDLMAQADGRMVHTTSEAGDAANYHLPVIRAFVEQWPEVDIVGYASATSPGFHLVLAGALALGVSEDSLRWISLGATAALVGGVAVFACAVSGGLLRGLLLSLPLILSSYVLSAACWVTTDNAALAVVAWALAFAVLGQGKASASVWGGLCATLAVGVRQLHVWTIAPLGLSAALGAGLFRVVPAFRPLAARLGFDESARVDPLRAVCGAVGVLLPAALLAYFVWRWGGLMPPTYRGLHAKGIAWSAPALSLSLAGIFGTPLLAHAWRAGAWRASDPLVLIGAVGGLLTAVVPATSWDPDTGRMFGWLWEVVRRAPDVGERSLLLALLATVGGAALAILWRGAAENGRARGATILLFAGVCWCTAQMANTQAWQRYMEPPVLAGVIWLAALAMPKSGADSPKLVRAWRVLGPLTLAGWLGIVSVITIYAKVF